MKLPCFIYELYLFILMLFVTLHGDKALQLEGEKYIQEKKGDCIFIPSSVGLRVPGLMPVTQHLLP